jgi:hypothetical protein
MIWHIFKKDFRLLWHFAAGVAALEWFALALLYNARDGHGEMWAFLNIGLIIQILASGILVATVVHLDAIPGVRQDWLVRPIQRRDLLLAKLLFVVMAVQGPMLIGDLVEAMASGVPFSHAAGEAILRNVCWLVAFYLPIMAYSSITASFTENIVAVVITAAAYSLFATAITMTMPSNWRSLGSTGVDWLMERAILLVTTLGATAVLGFQYFTRRTLTARWLLAGFVLLCLFASAIPWQPAFAIQQRMSPVPGGASSVKLEFQPAIGRHSGWEFPRGYSYVRREAGTALYIPIQIEGLGPDTILRTDLVRAWLTAPGDGTEEASPVIPPLLRNDIGPSPGHRTAHSLIWLPVTTYERLRNTTVRLDLDYSLTLLRLANTQSMPALDSRANVPGFGRCETRMDKAGLAVQLHCFMNPSTPPCAAFYLENPANGNRNPDEVLCHGQYTPVYTQYVPDALRRAMIDLPFRNVQNLVYYPLGADQLRESRVAMRFYQPVEHFTRHLSIPEVRLSDWLPK